MKDTLNLAMVLVAMVLWSAHPAICMPAYAPLADPNFIPSLQSTNEQTRASQTPQVQKPLLNEVSKNHQLGSMFDAINRPIPFSDTQNIRADLSNFAMGGNVNQDAQETSLNEEVAKNEQLLPLLWGAYKAYNAYRTWQTSNSDEPNIQADSANGGNIDLDALADQLQNILNSQRSAATPIESVAEAQRRRYWPIIRDFLDNILSPTDAPSKQPDTTALAEDLENALNRQFFVLGSQPVHGARIQFLSSIRRFLENHLAPKCIDALYIMAFTTGDKNAFTRNPPIVELTVGDQARGMVLPELPGETFIANKGDLWKINLSGFGFTDTCITKREVEAITLIETGTDGWQIDSIVTFLKAGESFILLSSDIDIKRWVDGNQGAQFKRFSLSIK